ncbi:MAG: cyclase family protein [Lachnospiraceae bacterium]|nr:cyclase family protein [Lachnospiraceae bacterium]
MDPPAHLYADRTTLDRFPVEQFIGKALVIDCRELHEGEAITVDHILKYGEKADKADFLLFNLGWDKYWGMDAHLTRHKKLFKECDIVNIENLMNLELCGDELFWFSCFPLKMENCDGSPIRAIAWFE